MWLLLSLTSDQTFKLLLANLLHFAQLFFSVLNEIYLYITFFRHLVYRKGADRQIYMYNA